MASLRKDKITKKEKEKLLLVYLKKQNDNREVNKKEE